MMGGQRTLCIPNLLQESTIYFSEWKYLAAISIQNCTLIVHVTIKTTNETILLGLFYITTSLDKNTK